MYLTQLAPAALLVLVLSLMTSNINACSMPEGWTPPTTIQQLRGADVIVQGKVTGTAPDRRWSSGYSATMEIHCVLKGPRTPKTITIRGAGYIPGMCTATVLEVGKTYLVPLSSGDEYMAVGVAFEDAGQVAEALHACGLNSRPTYPLGVTKASGGRTCPSGLPPAQCRDE